MKILEIRDLSFKYPGQDGPTLSGLDFSVNAGEIVYICGPTGAGKSTLLHCLKREIKPRGLMAGTVLFKGKDIESYGTEQLIRQIGIVFQDPENQTVMDTVIGEMAFGLENLGLSASEIKQRLSEVAGYFGVEPLLQKVYRHLSGGERQTVNLCAVLAMRPEVLLLDEPVSQLDPVARAEFTGMIRRINEDFGMTILISDHSNDEMQACADKLLVLVEGRAAYFGPPKKVAAAAAAANDHKAVELLPAPVRLFASAGLNMNELPLTIREARQMLRGNVWFRQKPVAEANREKSAAPVAISAADLLFAYSSAPERPVLKNLDLSVRQGEFVGIAGGNGSGKSTLLKLLCGLSDPLDGRVRIGSEDIAKMRRSDICGKVFYIPQNPLMYFTFDNVAEEISDAAARGGAGGDRIDAVLDRFGLGRHLKKHPYDLSGGERQKVLMACAVLRDAGILLLDEATKGLDHLSRQELGRMLSMLAASGKTIVMVSHDLEFMASFADRCAMLFDGSLGTLRDTRDFFRDNYFYTTSAKRIFRDILPEILTIEEVTAG